MCIMQIIGTCMYIRHISNLIKSDHLLDPPPLLVSRGMGDLHISKGQQARDLDLNRLTPFKFKTRI